MNASPPVASDACRKASSSASRLWSRNGFLSAVAALLATRLIHSDGYYREYTKQDFRGAAAHGAAWLKQYGDVPIVAHAFNKAYFEYYLDRYGVTQLTTSLLSELERLPRLLDPAPSQFILLAGHKRLGGQAILQRLLPDYRVVHYIELNGADAAFLRQR